MDFSTVPQSLQDEYLDTYKGIQSDIVNSSRFDKNSDISTTYLGRIGHKKSQDKLKAEESFPISENGYTLGRLLDGMKCQLLLEWVLVSLLCQNHSICTVSHCTLYQK